MMSMFETAQWFRRREELVRLLLVIDAEAGSEYADREAKRLGLTRELAGARHRRNRSVLGATNEEAAHERTGGQD